MRPRYCCNAVNPIQSEALLQCHQLLLLFTKLKPMQWRVASCCCCYLLDSSHWWWMVNTANYWVHVYAVMYCHCCYLLNSTSRSDVLSTSKPWLPLVLPHRALTLINWHTFIVTSPHFPIMAFLQGLDFHQVATRALITGLCFHSYQQVGHRSRLWILALLPLRRTSRAYGFESPSC